MIRKILIFCFTLTLIFTLFSCSYTINNDNFINAVKTSHLSTSKAPSVTVIPDMTSVKPIITSFIACGDNIIYGTKEALRFAQNDGRKYNYKPYYKGVADIIEKADIAFINQETLMCGEGYALSYYPMFNSPQELGYDLCELGFDVVNIANNHMLDKSDHGLSKTIDFWKNMDTLMIGGYENKEDFENIRVLEKNGLKIAFLSFTYATNGISKSSSSELYIPYINDEDIITQSQKAKAISDLVIASVHWGVEGSFVPSTEQKRVAQLFADCKIDAIIGHHPHVIQPVEWILGKDGNKTLCVYSLGNFMAQQAYDYNMVGGIISFDIIHSKQASAYIDNVLFTPTVFHFNGAFTDNNVYRMQDYTPSLASVHGVRTYFGHSLSYDKLISYAKNTIDKQFLPEFLHD